MDSFESRFAYSLDAIEQIGLESIRTLVQTKCVKILEILRTYTDLILVCFFFVLFSTSVDGVLILFSLAGHVRTRIK